VTPERAAELDVLSELYNHVADLVRSQDEGALNWAPLAHDTNSIAALVHHSVGSTRVWLARALGESFDRDREAEFRRRGTAEELLAVLDGARAELNRTFERLDTVDLARTIRVTRVAVPEGQTVSAAWCVEHAIAHVAEHWGAIQLTAQLYGAGPRAREE
jgi:uncharacterized damage-inducible protein DinB